MPKKQLISRLTSILIVTFFLTLCHHNLKSQNRSTDGDFETDFIIGCGPFPISIQNKFSGTIGSAQYIFDNTIDPSTCPNYKTDPSCFNGTLTANNRFTYNTPGTYYAIQILGTATVPRVDYIRIDVLDYSNPPAVTVNNCQGNSFELIFDKNSDPYDYYSINFQDGPGNTIDIQNWNGDTPYSYTFSNPGSYNLSIRGHFNNGTSSSCVSPPYVVSAFQTLPTPEITSLEVLDGSKIKLTYNRLAKGLKYELLTNDGTGFRSVAQIDPNTYNEEFNFEDPGFNFSQSPYAFQLLVTDDCGSSNQTSKTAYSIASQLTNENISDQFTYDIQWSTFQENFTEINLISGTSLLNSYNTHQSSTTISLDNCNSIVEVKFQRTDDGIVSTGILMKPFESTSILLPSPPPNVASIRGSLVELTLPPTHFPLGEYIVYRKDTGPDFQEVFRTASANYTDTTIPSGTSEVCYRIAYMDECGNQSEVSTESCLVLSTSLGVPNAFSPNGDQINDEFKISEGIYANFKMAIFNRWGTLVYYGTDPAKGWNGDYEGQPARSGTYLYRISFQNADNLLITKSGSFVLIR